MLSRFVIVLTLVSCGEPRPRTSFLQERPTAPREACALAEQKCTRCHTVGRVLTFDAHTREEWEPVVMRMRQMPSSGITRADAMTILDCLSVR